MSDLQANPLIVGQWYWITYSYVRLIDGVQVGEKLSRTEKAKCHAIDGETGIFDTDLLGYRRLHHTRCVHIPSRGFWANLFS